VHHITGTGTGTGTGFGVATTRPASLGRKWVYIQAVGI
jgi:hypothetical protein